MNKLLKVSAVSAAALIIGTTGGNAASMKVGGFVDMKFSAHSNDSAYENSGSNKDYVNFDVRNDSEIYFKGSAKLDNGISISTQVQLEGYSASDASDGSLAASGNQSADYIDEAKLEIKGSFGKIRIGSADLQPKNITSNHQAALKMHVGESLKDYTKQLIAKPSTVATSSLGDMDLSSDGEGVSWLSPRMNGFQIALGYAAQSNEDYDGLKRETDTDHNIVAAAVNWAGKLGGTKVSVAAGYTTSSDSVAANSDPTKMVIGGTVASGPVAFGLSIYESEDAAASGTHNGMTIFEAGVKYSVGPNSMSLVIADSSYNSSEAAKKDDSTTTVGLAFARNLSKGVKWHNTMHFVDYNDGLVGAGAANSNDGYAFTTGLKVSF